MNFLSFSPKSSQDWRSYAVDLLFSVQSRKHLFDLVLSHYLDLSSSDLDSFLVNVRKGRFFLSEPFLNLMSQGGFVFSHKSKFAGDSYYLRSIFTDSVGDDVLFFSNKWLDFYHERAVRWLTRISLLEGLKFVRVPSSSRYDGHDLEFQNVNVEFESGLKKTYVDLENRIILSRLPVLVVVPNMAVRFRYSNHFKVWTVDVVTLAQYRCYLKLKCP
jgi:hypothetical protein